jgi:large subunit ribosomal protein L29
MDVTEIRDWDDNEIRARMAELQEERFRLKFRSATMDLENPRLLQVIRRDIAKMKTVLRERELAGQRGR